MQPEYKDYPEDYLQEIIETMLAQARKDGYTKGYRDGYNAHAKSRTYATQVYGPYTNTKTDAKPKCDDPMCRHDYPL